MKDADILEAALRHTETFSQTEAAAVLGVSQKTVSSWRAGSRPTLSPARRRRLLALLEGDPGSGQWEAHGHAGETWPDYLTEVLVREARAAEKRAEAAASWARWLEKEADGREATREEVERFRRAEYDRLHPPTVAPVIPGERETAEEEKRTA